MTATTIHPMTRRSGGLGAHGIYAEGVDADGNRLRAFLAGPVLGMSTLAAGAKGARWTVDVEGNAEVAQAKFGVYFGNLGMEISAVPIELTSVDVDRLARGTLISGIYPLQALLEKAAAEIAAEGGK